MVNGHRRRVAGAPAGVSHGRARQSSGSGPCGYCRRVARGGSSQGALGARAPPLCPSTCS